MQDQQQGEDIERSEWQNITHLSSLQINDFWKYSQLMMGHCPLIIHCLHSLYCCSFNGLRGRQDKGLFCNNCFCWLLLYKMQRQTCMSCTYFHSSVSISSFHRSQWGQSRRYSEGDDCLESRLRENTVSQSSRQYLLQHVSVFTNYDELRWVTQWWTHLFPKSIWRPISAKPFLLLDCFVGSVCVVSTM